MLTEDGEQAVRAKSGPLYDLIIKALLQENPDCLSTPEEVAEALPLYLWPPRPIRDLCSDFPHIPVFPTHYWIEDRQVEVLICHPNHHVETLVRRTALRAGWTEGFGGAEGIDRLKQDFIAEGGTPDQFEDMMLEHFRRAEAELPESVITRRSS